MQDEIVVRKAKAAAAAEKAAADAVTAAEAAAKAAEAAALLADALVVDAVDLACLEHNLAVAQQVYAEERAAVVAAGPAAADFAPSPVRALFESPAAEADITEAAAADATPAMAAPVPSLIDTVRIIAPTRNYWQFSTGLSVDVTVELNCAFLLSARCVVSLCLRRPCNRFPMAQGSCSRRTSWQAQGSRRRLVSSTTP
jgi:hypothetical protein